MTRIVQLKCPNCKRRVIDAPQATKSELKVVDLDKLDCDYDYYAKCYNCKNTIGIRKVS